MIELLSHWGNDLTFANVARVSYGKSSDTLTEKDGKLIDYLVKHNHTSPFRHSSLQFRIKCPVYVERQIFKHNIGISQNSISGRYVDFSDTYFKIQEGDWRKQSTSSKQGSDGLVDDQYECHIIQEKIIIDAKESYEKLINLGVSKEQARTILPLNLNTEFIWTGTFQAFVHLCSLRLKPDAQKETRDVVQLMLDSVKSLDNNPYKYSLKSFNL